LQARERNLPLVIGSEFRLDDGLRLVLLACNLDGYGNLCELITLARRRAPKGSYQLSRSDLENISDCLLLWLPGSSAKLDEARWVATHFSGRAWIGVTLLRGCDDAQRLAQLTHIGAQLQLPLVALGDVHMHLRERQPLQDLLTAIRCGLPLAQAGSRLYPNAERHLRSRERLAHIYPPALLAETLAIAARCRFSLAEIRYQYPEELVPAGETPTSWLRRLTWEGATRRYPAGLPDKVHKLLEHELTLIRELDYESFFLTIEDIVRFAHSRNILCQGRGSAANSAVCYCLGITEVDPERMQTLFERFISKERNEPPDIDVDFEHQRREEVIQYIYERYGRERSAIAATVIRYRPKSAFRDAGKALGFSLEQVNKLCGSLAWWDGHHISKERLVEAGFDPDSRSLQQLLALVQEMLDFPRHLSQHVGGFVIDNRKLSRLVPIENAAMPKRSIIQWDKDDLEALGLLKVDVLALGMLSCIRRTLEHINTYHATGLRIQDIPKEDPAVYDMLCRADSIGVFQVESRAQMSMLPRLKPRCYYDLVIQVAIIRPGPIQGGMVHPYLQRRSGDEPVDYPSPEIRQVLERTLGVTIFQEQVMQIAMIAAGFSAGEADQLRRAMAAWKRKGGLEHLRQRLLDGMLARGYTADYAEQIYRMAQGFGEYGFPESHSASFALLVYVSSWLKCHHPAAFCAGLLNSQPLGFYSPSQLVQDARRHHVEVRPVDVMTSLWQSTLEARTDGEPALRLGLHMIKGLGKDAAQRIVAARQQSAFSDSDDFFRRSQLSKRDLNCLADANALLSLSGHRRTALWHILGRLPDELPLALGSAPETQIELLPPSEGENLLADYRRLGLTLGRHPLAMLRPRLQALKVVSAEEIANIPHRRSIHTAGIVTCRQRPGTAGGVVFVTLEDESGYINVIVWKTLVESQRRELLGSRLLGVYGVLERKDQVVHLVAGRLVDYSHLLGGLNPPSRDFH
ncbi:MAG TPA: error-prone DNA polymerase, partial [Pseudomonadaceae bacterium]|nr:error-prone DNA polymerase [Pseudomonadaceae bacterium]